jgi:putative endonuclease
MWFVYAIESLTRKYMYVGLTSNVEQRLQRHNEGRERTTRPYRPFRLILCEAYTTRAEARKREVYLKSGIGKEFLKAIVSTM